MNNAIYNFNAPANEPVLGYLSGSPERKLLMEEIGMNIPVKVGHYSGAK